MHVSNRELKENFDKYVFFVLGLLNELVPTIDDVRFCWEDDLDRDDSGPHGVPRSKLASRDSARLAAMLEYGPTWLNMCAVRTTAGSPVIVFDFNPRNKPRGETAVMPSTGSHIIFVDENR